jgi:flagellar biosynthetic protein FliR
MVEQWTHLIAVYVVVLFRVAAMMVFAPLLGSDRIPKRVKALMACVLAAGIAPGISINPAIPQTPWGLAIGIGGEIIFGLAMGMILSFVFVAAQWAGEIIGQQMGLSLGASFDPEFAGQGSVIGDMYFFITLIVFLVINGHHAMLRGVRESFDVLPPLTVGMDRPLLGLLLGLFQASTFLAMQLAAPILVTMLVVDVVLGFLGKTVPQLNIMSAGIPMRSLVGLIVIILGVSLTSQVIREALMHSMKVVYNEYAVR